MIPSRRSYTEFYSFFIYICCFTAEGRLMRMGQHCRRWLE